MEHQETHQRDELAEGATQQRHQGDIAVTSSHTLSDVISSRAGKVKLCLIVVFSDLPDAASRPPAAARLQPSSTRRPVPPSGQTRLPHAKLAQGLTDENQTHILMTPAESAEPQLKSRCFNLFLYLKSHEHK